MGNTRPRTFVLVTLAITVVLTALFTAQGATRLVASILFDVEPSTLIANRRTSATTLAAAGTRARRDPTPILRRNIFDSETGDLTKVAVEETAESETAEDVPFDPTQPAPMCEGGVRLVGAIVNVTNPEWSFAAISGSDGKALLYRPGMDIDGKELVGVQPNLVYLRPGGSNVCQLPMFQENESDGSAPRVAAVTKPDEDEDDDARSRGRGREREGAVSQNDLESGISRVSDTEYNVQRSLVNKVLENQAELMRTARIIPQTEGGRTVGVKLYGIRRNSLLGRLGIQNGDMLRTINGFDMTRPDSALEAYTRLKSADHLTVSIVRRGESKNLNFNIR